MKKLFIVFFSLLGISCSNDHEFEISKSTFDGKWPFTVDHGTLGCDKGKVYFKTGNKTYAINGMAKKTYLDPVEIWMDNPDIPGLKIGIGDVIKKGLELCNN